MPRLTLGLAFAIHPRYDVAAALDVEHPTLPGDVLRRLGSFNTKPIASR
jgi:hypothetical protein